MVFCDYPSVSHIKRGLFYVFQVYDPEELVGIFSLFFIGVSHSCIADIIRNGLSLTIMTKHFFKALFVFAIIIALGLVGILWVGNMNQAPSPVQVAK